MSPIPILASAAGALVATVVAMNSQRQRGNPVQMARSAKLLLLAAATVLIVLSLVTLAGGSRIASAILIAIAAILATVALLANKTE